MHLFLFNNLNIEISLWVTFIFDSHTFRYQTFFFFLAIFIVYNFARGIRYLWLRVPREQKLYALFNLGM